MFKSSNAAIWSWCSDPDAPVEFHNEARRRLELARLAEDSGDYQTFAYASVSGGAKTVRLKRETVDFILKESKKVKDTEERWAGFCRFLLQHKYMDQLCEKKVILREKGLPDEEIKTKLEELYPEPELLLILNPSMVNEFIRDTVRMALSCDEWGDRKSTA